jgi:2-polyprenyl-6-methoxyphenol hydroxylase-like FAD-dependent oxidoreductase
MFVFREELLGAQPGSLGERRNVLREVFHGMGWEVPKILARLEEVDDIYFDRVSQIRMDRWSNGRVVLIGDAAACVSLVAGEGTGLAMTEAYVLAGELHRAGGAHVAALREFELKLRPFLTSKQHAALRMARFLRPKDSLENALA